VAPHHWEAYFASEDGRACYLRRFRESQSMQLSEMPVKAQLFGTAAAGTGPDLAGYPHLTYAPAQWGEGVRIARNGAPISDIALDAQADCVAAIDSVARSENLSWAELFDALRYARANGAV
jgi:hypothetical protein